MTSKSLTAKLATFGIAALCFGYFAAYVPYSMMAKMLTKGLFPSMNGVGLSGFEIQPVVCIGSVFATFVYITFAGWWKFATHSKFFGISLPRPQWFTFVSGICLSGQIVTTTLAYTFSGVSIVFAMLLMRGGVLFMGPIVDLVARKRKRKIYWPSWVASLLSLGALLISFFGNTSTEMTIVAACDIGIYLFVYFFRLLFMSNRAKSDDSAEKKRYFVEEQLVANVSMVLILFIIALFGIGMAPESIPAKLWAGFTVFPGSVYALHAFIVGLFSYGTGLFGTLIFLDKRENTFTVPANRSSSILAGVVATYLLAFFYAQKTPPRDELIGVALILGAIVFLAYRSIVDKKSRDRAKAATTVKKKLELATAEGE